MATPLSQSFYHCPKILRLFVVAGDVDAVAVAVAVVVQAVYVRPPLRPMKFRLMSKDDILESNEPTQHRLTKVQILQPL